MRLKIAPKLFLALLLTNTLIIGAMAGVLRWRTERDFPNYLRETEVKAISPLVEELARYYRDNQGWDGLRCAIITDGGDKRWRTHCQTYERELETLSNHRSDADRHPNCGMIRLHAGGGHAVFSLLGSTGRLRPMIRIDDRPLPSGGHRHPQRRKIHCEWFHGWC